jgi:type II secretory pathway pseudopilin PulG
MASRKLPAFNRRGFTMGELLVVMAIMVTMTITVISAILPSAEQAKAHGAKMDLYAIASAQQRYYEDTGGWNGGSYCVGACASSTPVTSSSLHLTLTGAFQYTCSAAPAPYQCTATDGVDTITLNPAAIAPAPMVTCAPVGINCPVN